MPNFSPSGVTQSAPPISRAVYQAYGFWGDAFFPKIHPYIPCQMLVGYCDVATLRIIQLERFVLVLIFLHGGLAQR